MNKDTPKKAVLWDLDGTLVDSREYHWQSWCATMKCEGYTLTRTVFEELFGQRNVSMLRRLLGNELPVKEVSRISFAKEEFFRQLVRNQGLGLLPGVSQLLMYLKNKRWVQCVASSAPRENITTILDQVNILDLFDAVVSGDEIEKGKPDPEIFLRTAERVGVDPKRCIVIEDAPVGIEAARRADMLSIGVLSTHTQLSADIVVSSLEVLSPNIFDSYDC